MADIHEDGAIRVLDSIRQGGEQLIAQIRQRIWLALDSLAEGDMSQTGAYLADALQSVTSIAQAEAAIAILDGSLLIKAADVEVGMTLTNVGDVTDVNTEECPNEKCRRHITVKIGTHEMEFRGDQEVYVRRGHRSSS